MCSIIHTNCKGTYVGKRYKDSTSVTTCIRMEDGSVIDGKQDL